MDWKAFHWRSLKTRVTLSTLAILLVGIWSLAFYASHVLRDNMTQVLGDHQFASVMAMATTTNDELEQRFTALEDFARLVVPSATGERASLSTLLARRPLLRGMFVGGFVVYGRDGVVIDIDARLADRLGTENLARALADDTVAQALRDVARGVGRPTGTADLDAPLFPMTVPMRDARGNLFGAISGWTTLDKLSFVDPANGSYQLRSGLYLLIAPKYQVVVMASDKSRVLEKLPKRGTDATLDRFMRGEAGSGLSVDSSGVELLSATAQIPLAGWTISAALPTDVAFMPIRAMQQRMLLATAGLTLFAGGLTWWMLRRQLAPMLDAARTLAALSDATHPLPIQPLRIEQNDEVGELIGGFNHLLSALDEREQARRESEERYRTMVEWSPDAIVVHASGTILYVNPAAMAIFGASAAKQLVGTPILRRAHPDSLPLARQRIQKVVETGRTAERDALRLLRIDGSLVEAEVQSTSIVFDGAQAVHTVMRDLTQRRHAESEQRIAATAFESLQGMFVTDANWVILRVNRAFTEITGYSAEEAVGQTPLMLRSGRHDDAFFDTMNDSLLRTGSWQGEIWDRRKNGEIFPEWLSITAVKDEAGKVTNYVDTFTDITSRKAAEEQIQSLAFYDPLTRLPNRRYLMDRLEQVMALLARHQRKGALLFVDLDNFKTLNDTHGHHKGDLLLQEVALRLSTCIRKGDTVARLGGDEFVVMLEDLSESAIDAATQAEAVAEKVLATLNQNYQLGGYSHHSTPSVGITLFGEKLEGIEEPLKRADLAMYQAKNAGRNTMRFFDPQMQEVVSARASLETGLRAALAGHQLELYYQPQMLGESQLTGVEALVRWNHPERGMVSPAEFIPLAEETGLILPLGLWVLESACKRLAAWAEQPAMAHLTIAVNVSPRQFHQRDFVGQVLAVLGRTHAQPQRLKLELTESVLVSNIEDVIAKMNELKDAGVGFSLDDFGTGFSSLSHLKLMPLDQLKIDQGFVRDVLTDPNDAAIAKMVIALGDSLGLNVIAEGVETVAQREFLASQGCHAYQGYLFSRPLPLAAFEDFVKVQSAPSAPAHQTALADT